MKEDEMKIIKVLVDEMPSGCKRCDFCVAKMYCLLLEDRKTTVPDEPYKRRTDCPLVYGFGDRETNALNKRIAELSQAVGLITTLKPTMVMDVDHPLDMAKEVVEHVTARIAELEMKIRHNALWQASEDAEERAHLEKLVPDLKKRIAELEERLGLCESALVSMTYQFFYSSKSGALVHSFMSAEEEAAEYLVDYGIARWENEHRNSIVFEKELK
ncbi:MAG: hypothetical protein WC372_09730 [Candidatus Neomarinimicrobiota bacterium]|jgi:hypothetical protein